MRLDLQLLGLQDALGLSSRQDFSAQSRLEKKQNWFPSRIVPKIALRVVVCQRGSTPIWALGLTYDKAQGNFRNDAAGKPVLLLFKSTLRTKVLSAEQAEGVLQAEKLQVEMQRLADTRRLEREATLEREGQQRITDKEVEAKRVAAQWPAKVAAFQARLKVGDRFKWGRAPIWGGPFVGMVVRVEGTLAFVQFDNLTFAGQQTRYLPKAELEPFEGPTPAGSGSIN